MSKDYDIIRFAVNQAAHILAAFVVVIVIIAGSVSYANGQTIGIVATDALNLREGPSSSTTSQGLLSMNKELTILDTVYNELGEKWYLVITPAGNRGYVAAQFVIVEKNEQYVEDAAFEANMSAQGFPESYKPYLRSLHANYPNWVFKAAQTGLNWNDVVSAESKVGTSLVPISSPSSWKSMEPGAYDFEKGQYIQYDSGGWVSASKEIVEYYLDPRNFINQVGVFQFLTHTYDPSTQTIEGLQKVIGKSFMAGAFPESTHSSYAEVLMEAGRKSGVNPYVLASMILVEQGSNGRGGCISGTVSGYEGFYNFFNIGAYRSGSMDAVARGLWYASQSGSYDRPWNTRAKSIIGGAKFYGNNYVLQNKNTLYFKKFNVMNGQASVGKGQYMTNIQGAESEAAALRNGYLDALDDPMTFEIPVYNGMPAKAAPKPTSTGSTNNYLAKLDVLGYKLTPAFTSHNMNYELVVDKTVPFVNIAASASSSGATVSGTGKVMLSEDNTKVVIKVTSSGGSVRNYIIRISKVAGGQVDENAPQLSSSKYTFDEFVCGVGEKTSVTDFGKNISVNNGTFDIVNAKGNAADGNISTGMKLVLKNKVGETVTEYPFVVKGDINGDSKINSADALAIQRHIVETRTIKGAYLRAADINGDGRVNSLDVLYVQKHIVGSYNIEA